MTISFVDSSSATASGNNALDLMVPLGTVDGDYLLIAVNTYIPATGPPEPDGGVSVWFRFTTFDLGYNGKGIQVWGAPYDSATMPPPGSPITVRAHPSDSPDWCGILLVYRGTAPITTTGWCFDVPGAYFDANASPWGFVDWFDNGATPYGPYDRMRFGIEPEDMCVYFFGILCNGPQLSPLQFRPPGASNLGDPPPPGIEFRDYETITSGATLQFMVIAACDELGSNGWVPGVTHRDWDINNTPDDVHTVGVLLRNRNVGAGGFVAGYVAI